MSLTYFDSGVTIGFVDDGSGKKTTDTGIKVHLDFNQYLATASIRLSQSSHPLIVQSQL